MKTTHTMRTACFIVALLSLIALTAPAVRAEEKVLCDFENDQDMIFFDMKTGKQSDQHATGGKSSLKILPGEYMTSYRIPHDWSAFDSLELDAFVDGESPVNGTVLVGDKPWEDNGRTYWDRHNGTFNLKPGANVISIPVNGLFRGEAGSRGNGLHTNIDPKQITRLDLGFTTAGKVTAIYLDRLRFSKETRPDGILAFDFGPESQTLFPGFTPISWNTVYGQNGLKAGLKQACGSPNRARDDTFPTRLYQDFVWFEENGNEFIADVPNGKYHVWVVFDDCGYWGGEEAQFHKRIITCNGKEAFVEDRGADGPTDYLFRFEKIEAKPGDSLWDLYVRDLFKPARFETEATDGKIHIHAGSDAQWSAKVAAIIIYPDAGKAAAEKWVAEVEARNKKEFETRAVFMGPNPHALQVPADAQSKGFWLGFPTLEETVTFVDAPGKTDGKLLRTAARGQRLSYTFAIRPLKDFSGEPKLSVGDLSGPGGKIPAAAVDLRYVHHLTQRGFNDISYTIAPMSLRHLDASGLKLSKDLTRQFWIMLDVPENAKPGVYQGEVSLSAGELSVKLPFSVEVLDLALDDPDFNVGFLGSWIPSQLPAERHKDGWYELGMMMKKFGMNSFCGGPNIPLEGFDESGKPKLNFTECDAFFKSLRRAGYTHPVYSYGSPAMVEGLQDGYAIGETAHGWEKKTGKPFSEVLKLVWNAVKEHSEKENWLPVYYGLLDEPRVVEGAQENLAFHKAYRDAVPFVKTGGFYSVNWKDNGPLEKSIQDIFKTMYWSGVNSHTQDDLDNAKKFNKELHIYNQGLDRFTFGAYCWAEMHKGVKGLMQWHTLALGGYQWFDLDSREPDPGVINWGRKEVIPTLYAARCCEGAYDLRLATTLWNLAEKKKGTPEAKAAQDYLESVSKQIDAGKTAAPKEFSDGEAFRGTCVEHLRKLLGK